jgi:hypothetical protein
MASVRKQCSLIFVYMFKYCFVNKSDSEIFKLCFFNFQNGFELGDV